MAAGRADQSGVDARAEHRRNPRTHGQGGWRRASTRRSRLCSPRQPATRALSATRRPAIEAEPFRVAISAPPHNDRHRHGHRHAEHRRDHLDRCTGHPTVRRPPAHHRDSGTSALDLGIAPLPGPASITHELPPGRAGPGRTGRGATRDKYHNARDTPSHGNNIDHQRSTDSNLLIRNSSTNNHPSIAKL